MSDLDDLINQVNSAIKTLVPALVGGVQ